MSVEVALTLPELRNCGTKRRFVAPHDSVEDNHMSDSPFPPPPLTKTAGRRPPAKKVWARPTFRRIENGVVVTESGANVNPLNPESGTYRPNS